MTRNAAAADRGRTAGRPGWRFSLPAAALAAPVRLGLLLGGLVIGGLVLGLLDRQGLARLSPMRLVVAGAALCAAGAPRQAVAFAAGYAQGPFVGAGLALAAQGLGCGVDFVWARLSAAGWARRRVSGRLVRIEQRLIRRPFLATLMLRLLPVGNNLLLSLAAGISEVRFWPFLAGSLLGYVPQTAVFALAGSGSRLGRAGVVAVAASLLLFSLGLGAWLLHREDEEISPAAGSGEAAGSG